MMEAALVVFYTLLLGYLLQRLSLVKNSGLPRKLVWLLVTMWVLGALAFGAVHWYIYGGSDTWDYFKYSKMVQESFYINPLYFLELVFGPNARRPPPHLCEIIEPIEYWSDVRTYMMLRVHALLHFTSFGYYGVHAVWSAMFSFVGLTGVYRVFRAYSSLPSLYVLLLVYGLPSVWFWTSGLHKDSLTMFAMGVLLHSIHCLLQQFLRAQNLDINSSATICSPKSFPLVCSIVLSGVFLLLLRPYSIGLLALAVAGWIWNSVVKKGALWQVLGRFALVYVFFFVAASAIAYIHPSFSLYARLVRVQFIYVTYIIGQTDLNMNTLQPSFLNFMYNTPQSLFNVLVSPFFKQNSVSAFVGVVVAAENLFLIGLPVGAMLYGIWQQKRPTLSPFLLFCLFFSLSYFILIGLIADNVGAIVRYRSVVLPFWMIFWLEMALSSRKKAAKIGQGDDKR